MKRIISIAGRAQGLRNITRLNPGRRMLGYVCLGVVAMGLIFCSGCDDGCLVEDDARLDLDARPTPHEMLETHLGNYIQY